MSAHANDVVAIEYASAAEVAAVFERFTNSSRMRAFIDTHRRQFIVYARHHHPMLDDDDVDDAWQVGVAAVFTMPGKFRIEAGALADSTRFEAALAGYLHGTVRNQARRRVREIVTAMKRSESLDALAEDEDAIDRLMFDLEALERRTDWLADIEQRRRFVERCLDKLSALARRTFALALIGEEDVRIQAQTNSGSAVAVRRRISEAKASVVACVEKQMGGRV
ncbi:hypothetical protein [Paraburkholderia lycopersici]|uniref:Uncharacterized protein n=1 Tax=Paraburkholderia lycopersici TaxID=416944 RepID=A0A1G7CMW8_9BURK|nr:hypothetical protein [Paraburkholderia lycopersici]SDE40006.1 hypothetical protein SAMN05421548_14617 [Paraburkholderia lycopersici]